MHSPSGQHRFRAVVAPQLPAKLRERLATDRGADPSTVALAGVLTVLFGVAGVAVIVSGAAPRDASPVLFGAVAGGGGLLIALVAALTALRGAAALRRSGAVRRAGLLIDRHTLDELATRQPAAGAVVARTQRAVDRIRASEAYRTGNLSTVIDNDALDRIEWTVAEAALRRDDTGRELVELAAQVTRLEKLADTAEQLGAADPARSGGVPPATGQLSDELERSTLVAEEMLHLRRSED
ncbi:MAG: hypothetical protein WCA46_28055 [Actinocatenispora sp.]